MPVIAPNIYILGNAFRLVVISTSWRATKLEVEPWRFSFLAAGPKVKSIQNLEKSITERWKHKTETIHGLSLERPFPWRPSTRHGSNAP